MPKTTTFSEQNPPAAVGAAMQSIVPAAVFGNSAGGGTNQSPALTGLTVPASGNILSNAIPADGYTVIAVGIQSTQAGAVNIQRYLDDACTIKQGAVVTQALTTNTFANLNVTDGLPFSAFTLQVTNTGGSPATLSNFMIMLQAR